MARSIIPDLKLDCGRLVDNFTSLETSSFTEFLKLWKEHNFDLIYAGQGESDIDYFIFHIIHVAKGFTQPTKTRFQQIGGLYLLYLLYYTEPLKIKKPIRLIPDEFLHLRCLAEEFKSENKEVSYAFYKLLLDSAFDFVISPLPYDENLIHHKEEIKMLTNKNYSENESRQSIVDIVMKDSGFQKNEWTKMVRIYNNIKRNINNCSTMNLKLTKLD